MGYADYMDFHYELHCDSENNRAEIVPYAVFNKKVYNPASQDCTFSNGRTIRVKMGLGKVYPYGMGGGDPSKWISVWIDKALVLSYIQFSCGSEGPCNLQIIVTSKGLEVCHRDLPEFLSQQGFSKATLEKCEFIPNNKLSIIRDSLEFPLPNEKARPAAGSLVTMFAKDENLCSQFKLLSEPRGRSSVDDNIWPLIGLPNDAESIEKGKSLPYEYDGMYQLYTFDINNDLKNETVLGLHARTNYRDGDVYFVFPDGKVSSPTVGEDGFTDSELFYAKAAMRIIPHYWSDYIGKDEKKLKEGQDEGEYEIKSVSAPWWDSTDKPIFLFRYWYLWPFRYKHSTYFLTWSQEAGKQHWYTVLKPEPNYQVTEMCVFQVVRERY